MLSLYVGGRWLSTIGAYSPPTVEYGIHGLDAVSWAMDPDISHPVLRSRSQVHVFDGGILVGSALLQEPGSGGDFTAAGVWRQAERALAMDTGGALTSVPDSAVDGALSRGEITFGRRTSISSTAWSTTTQNDMTLAQLLDGYAAQAGLRWRVETAAKGLEVVADPTTPKWLVPYAAAGRGLTPADDEFYTHLVGWYMNTTTTYASATVGSAEAATAFGRRTGTVDLTPKGVIGLPEAQAVLTGMFLLAGARMGWAEGLELSYGQITNLGGTPAPLSQVQAGQMIRLLGTIDTSRANRLPAYTDLVIGTAKFTDQSNSITLTPIGYAPRNLADILKIAVEGE